MSKFSELDADRQQIKRLTDVIRPPSFAESKRAGSAMTLICRDDSGQEHRFDCANGFVTRVVSAIFHSDNMGCYSDAHRVMGIMNAAVEHIATVDRYHAECALADRMGAR